mmetsp:Transcript_58227/g.96150  ORF Transcript_58227/g.96150 Transcript_58227/m.96150 type:complete len:229 (+) Transcript_58227:204-890(+)
MESVHIANSPNHEARRAWPSRRCCTCVASPSTPPSRLFAESKHTLIAIATFCSLNANQQPRERPPNQMEDETSAPGPKYSSATASLGLPVKIWRHVLSISAIMRAIVVDTASPMETPMPRLRAAWEVAVATDKLMPDQIPSRTSRRTMGSRATITVNTGNALLLVGTASICSRTERIRRITASCFSWLAPLFRSSAAFLPRWRSSCLSGAVIAFRDSVSLLPRAFALI